MLSFGFTRLYEYFSSITGILASGQVYGLNQILSLEEYDLLTEALRRDHTLKSYIESTCLVSLERTRRHNVAQRQFDLVIGGVEQLLNGLLLIANKKFNSCSTPPITRSN